MLTADIALRARGEVLDGLLTEYGPDWMAALRRLYVSGELAARVALAEIRLMTREDA